MRTILKGLASMFSSTMEQKPVKLEIIDSIIMQVMHSIKYQHRMKHVKLRTLFQSVSFDTIYDLINTKELNE